MTHLICSGNFMIIVSKITSFTSIENDNWSCSEMGLAWHYQEILGFFCWASFIMKHQHISHCNVLLVITSTNSVHYYISDYNLIGFWFSNYSHRNFNIIVSFPGTSHITSICNVIAMCESSMVSMGWGNKYRVGNWEIHFYYSDKLF